MAEWAAALAPSSIPYSGFKKEPILCITVLLVVLTMIQHTYLGCVNAFIQYTHFSMDGCLLLSGDHSAICPSTS